MAQETVIDMDNYSTDFEDGLGNLTRKRYAMPPHIVAAMRQAGQIATKRLLDMVADDDKFEKLSPKDQLSLINAIHDRAYGKAETASASDTTAAKLGQDEGTTSNHTRQLEAIEARLADRKSRHRRLASPSPSPQAGDDADPSHDDAAGEAAGGKQGRDPSAASSPYPELSRPTRGGGNSTVVQDEKLERARNVVALRRKA